MEEIAMEVREIKEKEGEEGRRWNRKERWVGEGEEAGREEGEVWKRRGEIGR